MVPVLLLFAPFLSGVPGVPQQQQAGSQAATWLLSSAAAHSLITIPALKHSLLLAIASFLAFLSCPQSCLPSFTRWLFLNESQ